MIAKCTQRTQSDVISSFNPLDFQSKGLKIVWPSSSPMYFYNQINIRHPSVQHRSSLSCWLYPSGMALTLIGTASKKSYFYDAMN